MAELENDERLNVQSGPFKGKPQRWFTRSEVIKLLAASEVEIRNDNAGKLDEFFARRSSLLHVERMNDGHWWMGVDMPDGSMWHLNFTTKRNTLISCFAERDEPTVAASPADKHEGHS
jgi:hypothetical protein